MIARRLNGSSVYRSADAGVSWSPIDVAPPPPEGGLVLADIVRAGSGRYLITGTVESRCAANIDAGDGFRYVRECRERRPVVFVSDDGDSWRRVEPAAMAPPDGAAVVIESVVAGENGFLAAGTVRAEDWHARLWSSPDGESWSLDQEIRDEIHPLSARQLLSDGSTVVLLTDLHPCADPWAGSPVGWYLGAGARSHSQLFGGTTAGNVQRLSAGEHPLAVADAEVDCTESTFKPIPYPRNFGAHVGGAITLLQQPPRPADGEVVSALEPYQVATLTAGTWTVARMNQLEVDPDAPRVDLEGLVDVDGRLGLLFSQPADAARLQLTAIVPDGEDAWAPVEFDLPLVASKVGGQLWSDGGLLVAGTLRVDPFALLNASQVAHRVLTWRSIDTERDAPRACELVAGGACQFADLSRIDGYPDFAGRDLSGIDLSFSELGEANFDGANLQGARIWDATGWAASFAGANLTGAAVQNTSIGDASDANFTNANLGRARIDGMDGAVFEGAVLDGARFEFLDRPPIPAAGWPGVQVTWRYDEDSSEPYELSLAGVDLTNMEIGGGFGDGPLLRITDLTGATLRSATFRRVDLSAIDASIDLSEVDFWGESVCPDGQPQDGDPRGTCVRGS